MAKLILCGLESKPKLNGHAVRLLNYHTSKGRWEVELEGDVPTEDLFRIEWNDAWFESSDEYASLRDEKPEAATFVQVLEDKLAKRKVSTAKKDLIVVDCNLRKVSVFDCDGTVDADLAGKYLPRKADTGRVSRHSFPLTFQKNPEGGKTLGVRPSSMRIREDEVVDKLRFQKVEMCVRVTHQKPQLDGQFGELARFQAPSMKWGVRPDQRSLWDATVDGTACPVQLLSSEVCDESSGAKLQDPVRLGPWESVKGEKALYAAVDLKQGQVILEEEPSASCVSNVSALSKLWEQFRTMSADKQASIRDLSRGPDYLWRFLVGRGASQRSFNKISKKELCDVSEEFRDLAPEDREDAWNILRSFDNNLFARTQGCFLYLVLSRLNHSCHPNALVVEPKWDPPKVRPTGLDPLNPCKMVLVALRDIAQDEEITISYIAEDELLEPTAKRRESLSSWGFCCACKRCATEDSDGLLRTFRCTNGVSCVGVHAATGMRLGPCNVCGSEARDTEGLLREEEMHTSAYNDLKKGLSAGSPLPFMDTLVQIIDCAVYSGLTPDHWIVCKAQEKLACCYRMKQKPDYAVKNIQSTLELYHRVFGCHDQLRVEALADLRAQMGDFVEAFNGYLVALQHAKQISPEHPAGQSIRCERIRRKLRSTLDGKEPLVGDLV